MKLYEGDRYDEEPFDTVNPTDSVTAEKYALQLMLFDNSIFGRTKFKLTDDRLFQDIAPMQADSRFRILEIKNRTIANQSLRMVTEIVTICVLINHCPYQHPPHCTGGPNGECDNCQASCATTTCLDFEIDTWYDDDWGGGGGSGGGGDSGGGDSGGNPTDPCRDNGNIISGGRLACSGGSGGGLGWEPLEDPIITPPHNPCDTLAKYSQGNDFQLMFEDLKTKVPSRKENMYIFNNPLIPSSPSNPIHLTLGNPDEFSVYPQNESQFQNSWGWMHNHFADEDSAGLNFSAGDLNILAEQIIRDSAFFHVDYTHFMIGMVGDSSTQYVLMVENINQFASWANILFKDEQMIKSAFTGAGLSQKFLPISVAETEKRFLKVIKNAGLKLFRGSNNSQTFTPIGLNRDGNVITINCQ